MKNIFFVFALLGFISTLFGQENYKGKISLMLDEKKIEVSITKVFIRKGDNIQIEVFAEREDGEKGETVMLYFSIDGFNPQKISTTDLAIKVDHGLSRSHRTKFSLMGDIVFAHYFSGPKQLNFSNITTNFDLTEVSHKNNSFIIIGNFSGIYSVETKYEVTSGSTEIKDGKFEIVF